MKSYPRIWVLLGHRKGDNNQLLALAQGLGLPFETRSLRYNILRRLPKRMLGRGLGSVARDARGSLQPPWPDLVLGIGHRSVPVARYIRKASGGRARIVQLGNPRLDPKHFDLVITMPQYHLRKSGNVVRLPLAMASPNPKEKATDKERAFLHGLPRPHRLIVIGGPNRYWRVDPGDGADAVDYLAQVCAAEGGTIIAIDSPRTELPVERAVSDAIMAAGPPHKFIVGNMPGYLCLLEDADEIYVTADSVSMLSEAVFTGKPVGMIPVRPKMRGRVRHALSSSGLGRMPRPDLRAVWSSLKSQGLVGTIEKPCAGKASNPVAISTAAVLELLKDRD